MEINLKNVALAAMASLALLLIGAAIGRNLDGAAGERELNKRLTGELNDLRERHDESVTVMNDEISTLQDLIDSKDSEIGVQADLILKLKDKPADVKYVIKTVTVFKPINVPMTVAVKDLPAERLFGFAAKDGGKIVIERMESSDLNADGIPDEVTFTPYEQTVVLDAALSETSSSFLLRVKTGYDDQFHDVPVDVKVTHINKDAPARKVIDPVLGMQVGGFAGGDILSRDPLAGYAAGVNLSWLHPTTSIDLLSPAVTLGTSWHPSMGSSAFVIRGGIDVISYNLGSVEGGLLRDTWLGADVGLASDRGLSGGLVVGTRL